MVTDSKSIVLKILKRLYIKISWNNRLNEINKAPGYQLVMDKCLYSDNGDMKRKIFCTKYINLFIMIFVDGIENVTNKKEEVKIIE